MYQRIIQIENEIEWIEVQRILERNDIPFMSNQVQNTAFPDLNTHKKYHQIVIPDQCSEQYFNLIESGYPNKIITLDEKTGSSKLLLYFIIAYGVVMSLLFLKYYQVSQRGVSSKNFVYEWSTDSTQSFTKSKQSNELLAVFTDRNFDDNYEKIESYSTGQIYITQLDIDENGTFEEFNFFSTQGEFSGKSTDTNQDGRLNTILIVLENRDTLLLIDENSNGFFEIAK